MDPKAREDLTKVVKRIDEALDNLEDGNVDWVPKVEALPLSDHEAWQDLAKRTASAVGIREATQEFLAWFHIKKAEFKRGWGPWSRSLVTEEERVLLDDALQKYGGSVLPQKLRLRSWEAQLEGAGPTREDLVALAPILTSMDSSLERLRESLVGVLDLSVEAG